MKCQDPCKPPIPQIVRGADKTLDIFLRGRVTKMPLDISSATEIIVTLANEDGTLLQKSLSASGVVVISGPGGHAQAFLLAVSGDTDHLALSTTQDDGFLSTGIQVDYTIGGKLGKVNMPGSIEVVDPLLFKGVL